MSRTPEQSRAWMEAGTALFLGEVNKLSDLDFGEPSALPGWTRKHLVGHVAHNATALRNLAHWARTGEESPMYSSTEQRGAHIEASGSAEAGELRALVQQTASELRSDMEALDDSQWENEVLTAQGRTVPFTEVPWMRTREVMVHSVDVGTGVTFEDLPRDFLVALVDDIAGKRGKGGGPALTVTATDGTESWEIPGEGEPAAVTGTVPGIAAWLARNITGGVTPQGAGHLPTLPAWL